MYLACIHACNYYSNNQTFFLRSLSAPSLIVPVVLMYQMGSPIANSSILLQNVALTTNIINNNSLSSLYTRIITYTSTTLTTIGAVTSDGLTPLGLAVREGKLDTIKYLITEYNVDVNGKLVTRA